jgi:hypothetical protein
MAKKSFSILAALAAIAPSCILLGKPDETSGGGAALPPQNKPAPPKAPESSGTIEEQLATARGELAAAAANAFRAEAERDAARAEADSLRAQFDQATAAATDAQGQVAALTTQLSEATGKAAQLGDQAAKLGENCARLETLCGVKGIDPKAAVVPGDEGDAGEGGHVFDRWSAASGAEKTLLWRAHKDEIRAEGMRRAGKV